jgi:class 3 adenylate cyclase
MHSLFWSSFMQRTLLALWFADIAGYSTYAAEDESGALRLVEILQALSREIVPRHKGRVVKFVGDAVLAEFPSTELAVRAGAALSHEFREQSATGGEAHELRVGVHLADVAVAPDGDLYGDGVNSAARIQETAAPGQVVISEDVWRQLRGRREFQFQDLGKRSLKGTGSINLYAVNVQVLSRVQRNYCPNNQGKPNLTPLSLFTSLRRSISGSRFDPLTFVWLR